MIYVYCFWSSVWRCKTGQPGRLFPHVESAVRLPALVQVLQRKFGLHRGRRAMKVVERNRIARLVSISKLWYVFSNDMQQSIQSHAAADSSYLFLQCWASWAKVRGVKQSPLHRQKYVTRYCCIIHTSHVRETKSTLNYKECYCTATLTNSIYLQKYESIMNSGQMRRCYSASLSSFSKSNRKGDAYIPLRILKLFRSNFTFHPLLGHGVESAIALTRSSCIWTPHFGALFGSDFASLMFLSKVSDGVAFNLIW